MAQIKKNIVKDRNLTILHVSGDVCFEEVVEVLEDFYKSEFTSKLLWDFSDADLSALTRSDLEEIISTAKSKSHLREHGKTAIVASRDLDFGTARMYEILSELRDHPISHSVFKTADEALRWLED